MREWRYGSRFGAWIVLVGHHGRDHKNIDMLWASMGIDIPGKTSRDLIRIINGVGSGYAVSTPAELDCIAHIARETGVVLDPVYTGKAALAMVRDLEAVSYMTNLCESCSYTVHTRGMLGMFDKINALASFPSLSNKCRSF